jgi:hypothetical protein
MTKIHQRNIWLVNLIIYLAIGCSKPLPVTRSPTAPELPAAPTLSKTNTPLSASQTATVMPTSKTQESLDAFWTIYDSNKPCSLPCYWGITPGKTQWGDVSSKLAALGRISVGADNPNLKIYILSIDNIPSEISPSNEIHVGFFVEEGQVQAIVTNSKWVNRKFDPSLSATLAYYGPPDEIWIEPVITPSDISHYELVIYYSELGVLVGSGGDAEVLKDSLEICPQLEPGKSRFGPFAPTLNLWSPEMQFSFKEIRDSIFGGYSPDPTLFFPLEELQDSIDKYAFYQLYLDPGTTKCIDVKLDKLK